MYVDSVPTTPIDGTHTKHIDNRLTIAVSVYMITMCVFIRFCFHGLSTSMCRVCPHNDTTCELVCVVCRRVYTANVLVRSVCVSVRHHLWFVFRRGATACMKSM